MSSHPSEPIGGSAAPPNRPSDESSAVAVLVAPALLLGGSVAGRLPSGDEPRRLRCVHCHEEFESSDSEVTAGVVRYDESQGRWEAVRGSQKAGRRNVPDGPNAAILPIRRGQKLGATPEARCPSEAGAGAAQAGPAPGSLPPFARPRRRPRLSTELLRASRLCLSSSVTRGVTRAVTARTVPRSASFRLYRPMESLGTPPFGVTKFG